MDINQKKAEARALAAIVETGDATEEQVAELRSIVESIESHQAAAELASKAVRAAAAAEAIDTTDTPSEALSTGETVVRSIKGYDGRGKSSVVEVSYDARAAITTGDLSLPASKATVSTPATKAPLAGIVGYERVGTGAVEYTVTDITYGANFVGEGSTKPETTFDFTVETVSLETIANWSAATRQALEDEARLSSIIEGTLRTGLVRKIEAHIADVVTSNESLSTAVGANLLAAIRNGISAVDNHGYTATTVLLNPADYAALDLEVLGATNAGPVRNGTVWGLTAVASASVAAGTAFVGDFAEGVRLFDRGTAAVYVTDSHEGNFTKNVVTVLAETRVKAAVVAPKAICAVSID